MKIIDDLYWYPKFLPKPSVMGRGLGANIFAIDQGDEIWLFDCGLSILHRYDHFLHMMEQDGLSPDKISRIFITHAHPDHINALPELVRDFQPSIHLHENDREILHFTRKQWIKQQMERIQYYFPLNNRWKFLTKGITLSMWWAMGKNVAQSFDPLMNYFDSNQTHISGSRYDVEIHPSPGHTLGHTSYYISQLHAVITGDSINPQHGNKPSLNTLNAYLSPYKTTLEDFVKIPAEIFLAAHAEQVYEGRANILQIGQDAQYNLAQAQLEVQKKLQSSSTGIPIREFRNFLTNSHWTYVDQKVTPLIVLFDMIDQEKAIITDKIIKLT